MIKRLTAVCALALLLQPGAAASDWQSLRRQASGQTVDWFMYGGFPAANRYVTGYVGPILRSRFDIRLRQVPVKDITEAVARLLIEKQAGKMTGGQADLLWINGENFRTAKKNGLLFGPFAGRLPNNRWVDWQRPAVANDFGEPVGGLEAPWGSAQFVMVYDTARLPAPPRTMDDLIQWIRSHPGRFTYPAPPDFTGSAFVRHVFYHIAGNTADRVHSFNETAFARAAGQCFDLLSELAPYLWRSGKTYPESPMRLAHLLADGEVDFAMSYHPAEASKMIHDGLYPDSVRTFVFNTGTIANTHFVAIPFNASDRAGAMVTADFLLSPEAQLTKADPAVWGDFPAIDIGRLNRDWQERFAGLARGVATLPDRVLQAHRLPELQSVQLIALEKGWQRHVLRGK